MRLAVLLGDARKVDAVVASVSKELSDIATDGEDATLTVWNLMTGGVQTVYPLLSDRNE